MDGLMFDSERLVYENWQNIMDENGYEYDIEVFKQTIGKRKKEVELFYYDRYGKDFPYWDFSNACREKFINHVTTCGIPVKDGLYELLDFLKSQNIKMALATSTSRTTAELNLKSSDTFKYFDALVCGDDVKNGKPHPEVFLTAAKKLGVNPKDCAAFEDSINGIKSAYAAGMITVMVPDFLQPTEEIIPMISKQCTALDESIDFLKTLI